MTELTKERVQELRDLGYASIKQPARDMVVALCNAWLQSEQLRKDAAWGAHNGGAHQLLKIEHAISCELYAALREIAPEHALMRKYFSHSVEAQSGSGSACQSGSDSSMAKERT